MKKTEHKCKVCGKIFTYCRACLLIKDPYKDLGFCSKECYEESLNKEKEEVIKLDNSRVVLNIKDTETALDE